jgi:MoaA/NifB/PqqE/SkfB family radical SAM enzyme
MFMNEDTFQSQYGDMYYQTLENAKAYVSAPESLLAEIESEKAEKKSNKLYAPAPDLFAYRMTLYRGFIRYPERLKNFVVSKNEPRSKTRSFIPPILDLEPNSRCNFRCIMCQVSEWEKGKRADDLTYDDFVAFMEKHPYFTEIKLHGMGEPLMHKHYMDMVQYLTERDVWVRTTVNGSLLHLRDNYRRLIDAGIGEVQTSFDGATKEVFEEIRRNSNFERVVDNLTLLNAYANGKDRLYTRMWVLVQQRNRHQLFEFVELAKKMGFRRLTFSISLNDWGQEDWHTKNRELQAYQGLTTEEEETLLEISQRDGIDISVWYQADKYSVEHVDTLCPWVFDRPYVSSDMRVVPCAMIANPEILDLGDAHNLSETWNSSQYQAFRQAHLDGKIPECCRHCYHWEEDSTDADRSVSQAFELPIAYPK